MKNIVANRLKTTEKRRSIAVIFTTAILAGIFCLLTACGQSSESELEKNLTLLKTGNISGITLGKTDLQTVIDILGAPDVYNEKSDIRDSSEAIYHFDENTLYLIADSEYKINRIEYGTQTGGSVVEKSAGETEITDGSEAPGETDSALSEKVYLDYREAYKDILEQVIIEQQEKENGQFCRGALIDLNGDGQEELLYMYEADPYMMRYVIWTFKDGKPVKIADNELCCIAGGGRGGMFIVEYEGQTYPCRMYYTAEFGDFGIYHIYEFDLLGFATRNDTLFVGSRYSFRFGYYTRNSEINKEAFSFTKNRLAISMAEFELEMESLKNPTATLFDIFISDSGGGATLPELIETKLSVPSNPVIEYPDNFLTLSGEPIDFNNLPEPKELYRHMGANGLVRLLDYGVVDVVSLEYDGSQHFIEHDFKDASFMTSESISLGSKKADVLDAYKKYGIKEYPADQLMEFNVRYSSVVILDEYIENNNFLYVDNGTDEGIQKWGGLGALIFIFDDSDTVTMIIRCAPTSG